MRAVAWLWLGAMCLLAAGCALQPAQDIINPARENADPVRTEPFGCAQESLVKGHCRDWASTGSARTVFSESRGRVDHASADAPGTQSDVLSQLLAGAGLTRADIAPDRHAIAHSPTAATRLPILKAMMGDPLAAPYRIAMLDATLRRHHESPHRLWAVLAGLMGEEVFTSVAAWADRADKDPNNPPAWCHCAAEWIGLPEDVRAVVHELLWAIDLAERFRQRAFASVSPELTPELLYRQVVEGAFEPFAEPDFRAELKHVERAALLAGLQVLLDAVEQAVAALRQRPDLSAVSWRHPTALGEIVIDTTRTNKLHLVSDPLLIIDTGGDDVYLLRNSLAPDRGRISVLIDLDGDDSYHADTPAACASGAILGYGILWDGGGNDRHLAGHLAQGAAVFGMAALVSDAGDDVFNAHGHAQGFALGGSALLLNRAGNDAYTATTRAQGSGGPGAVALLVDAAGDDRYHLVNTPLAWPSSQAPERNVSLGQGAGFGLRADSLDGRSLAGGFGGLFDFAGDDTYSAQVFAQGAGFWEGLGVLVDGGGNDRFDAAWYALGAAAHRAAGVLLSLGKGDDRYAVSHTTSLAAAHDLSVAVFVDQGGDDYYRLGGHPATGDLGLGAANDNSIALFVDLAGDDVYQADHPACRAFGTARMTALGTLRETIPGVALFLDLGGDDLYPAHCGHPQDDRLWRTPGMQPSEVGLGVDGDYLSPFRLAPWTTP